MRARYRAPQAQLGQVRTTSDDHSGGSMPHSTSTRFEPLAAHTDAQAHLSFPPAPAPLASDPFAAPSIAQAFDNVFAKLSPGRGAPTLPKALSDATHERSHMHAGSAFASLVPDATNAGLHTSAPPPFNNASADLGSLSELLAGTEPFNSCALRDVFAGSDLPCMRELQSLCGAIERP